MRRFSLLMVLLLTLLVSRVVSAQDDTIEVKPEFTVIGQGQIDEVHVSGPNIIRVRAAFLDSQYLFAQTPDGDFRGFIAPSMDAPTGRFRLSVLVTFADGEQQYLAQELRVTGGAFDSRDVLLSGSLSELIDPDILADEFAILDPEIAALTGDASWQTTGIEQPFLTGISAGFGSFRHFNGSVWQRHTGVDFPQPIGTPVKASAAGRVVFSGELEIRGNYVLVDHGAGLFSGYGHLSKRLVDIGDVVQQGDIIGLVGNTGRSLGPHLHWELALGGVWVNPLEMARRLPAK